MVEEKKEKKIEVRTWRQRNSISEFFNKHPEFTPTSITNWLFSAFFIFAVAWGIFNVPWAKLMAGNTDVSINIGVPWPFFVIELMKPENLPIKFQGFLLDLLIYVLVAYSVDIIISYTVRRIKDYKKKHPANLYKLEKNKKQELELMKASQNLTLSPPEPPPAKSTIEVMSNPKETQNK